MPIDNGDGTFDYTNDYQADPSQQTADAAGNTVAAGVNAVLGYDSFATAPGQGVDESGIIYNPDGGVAKNNYFAGTDSDPSSPSAKSGDTIGNLIKAAFSKDNAHITMIGANFLAGVFNQKYKKAKMEADTKLSDAAMLRAQSESDLANQKIAAGNSMGTTNFGTAMAGNGIMGFKDLMATRRTRSGA